MPVERFLDTNVFVYAVDPTDQRKQEIARDLLRQGLVDGSTCTSYQVTQEWLNVVLKLARTPLGASQARAFIDRAILPITSVWPSAGLFHAALDAHVFQVHVGADAGAVANAEKMRLADRDGADDHLVADPGAHGPQIGDIQRRARQQIGGRRLMQAVG